MSEPGLRDRSRQRRHAAIARAAMTLFAERGYDETTVADIAAAAEVAPRTVSLYFPAKADLALASTNETVSRLLVAFGERRPGSSTLDVLEAWLAAEVTGGDPEFHRLSSAMFARNPQLRSLSSALVAEVIVTAEQSLAADLGVAPDDLRLKLLGGVIGGAISAHFDVVVAGHDPELARTLTFAMLRAAEVAVTSGQ